MRVNENLVRWNGCKEAIGDPVWVNRCQVKRDPVTLPMCEARERSCNSKRLGEAQRKPGNAEQMDDAQRVILCWMNVGRREIL